MILVERSGPLTTVQDLGRSGLAHLGVPRAGAVDAMSLRRANALVGNDAPAAGLEATLTGPVLVFTQPAVVALAGARTSPTLDGVAVALDETFTVPGGGRLVVGTTTTGLRSYLAVRGGIALAPVLGSRSCDTLAELGPPPLRAGDELPVGPPERGAGLAYIPPPVTLDSDPVLHVVPGPHAAAFPADALRGSAYTVLPASDRTGVRLRGPALLGGPRIASLGMVPGAVQVPPDGQPILLLANHPPTGGYPVVAVVCTADLPLAAQARPGTRLRFAATTSPA